MSRTHLPPLMECPLYTALGRGRENVVIPVQYFVVGFLIACVETWKFNFLDFVFSSHNFCANHLKKEAYLNVMW